MDVDQIQVQLVSKCKFQVLAFIALGIIYARGAWNVFGVLFLAADAGPTCDYNSDPLSLDVRSQSGVQETSVDVNTTIIPGTVGGINTVGSVVSLKDCYKIVSGENGTNVSIPCSSWVYEKQIESIVSEWDLVCVRAYLIELSTTLYMVGSMFGALLISPLSDRFGRRMILLVCLVAQAVIGSCVALSPNYALFTSLRFIIGFFNMGIGLCAYVMMSELFPAQHRSIPCCGFQIFWAFGIMLTALFGYVIRYWRHLQLVLSLPNLLCAVFAWFLPESLPWLISQKKMNQAQSVIERISRFNSMEPPNDLFMCETTMMSRSRPETSGTFDSPTAVYVDQPLLSGTISHQEAVRLLCTSENSEHGEQMEEGSRKNSSPEIGNGIIQNGSRTPSSTNDQGDSILDPELQIVDSSAALPTYAKNGSTRHVSPEQREPRQLRNALVLCFSPRIRLYSTILFYLFFVNSLSYLGISLSTPSLHGNQFLNLFLMGVVEIPAYIICVVVCQRIGRKAPLCIFMLMCGVMNIIAMLISKEASSGMSGVRLALVMLGKFAVTGSYSTVYLYAAEIFPTAVRNQAMGISSFFENFGSIAAPFIVFWAKSLPELPMILFGVVSVIGGLMVLALPETHQRPLPQTIEEVESWGMCKRRRTE